MDKEIVKEYSNNELTIVWKPKKCIHAAECVKELPLVYNPQEKPWIKIEKATSKELKDQIEKCPSGALAYYMINEKSKDIEKGETKVELMKNGPLLVYGKLMISDTEGKIEEKNKVTAFCRCGHSNNKPYCDGNHLKVAFKA